MDALYPERGMFFAASLLTGTVGDPVDMRNFVGYRGSWKVTLPKALAAPVTITFETAPFDPANDANPLPPYVALNTGGLCEAVTPFTLTIDPLTYPGYSATKGMAIIIPIQCRDTFVRASIGAAVPGVMVEVVGKAARQTES